MYPDFYPQYQQSLDLRARVNDLTQALEEPVFRREMLTLLLNYLLKQEARTGSRMRAAHNSSAVNESKDFGVT